MNPISYFTFFLFVISTTTAAQTVSTLFEANSNCIGLAADGNYLYASSTFNGDVHEIDVTQVDVNQTYNTTNGGFQFLQNGICKYGDYILVARGTQNKIIKFAPSASNILVEDVINVASPNGIAIRNSELFISSLDKIYKVDLSASSLVLTEIASNLEPTSIWTTGTIGLKVYGNYLYVSESFGISKINLDSGNYEKELVSSYTGNSFAKDDNHVFYIVTGTNEIFQVDLETQTFTLLITLDLFDYPNAYDICYIGGSLFITSLEGLKIAQIELVPLNISQLTKEDLLIYPNPSSDFLVLTNIPVNENIKIINTAGQVVKSLKMYENKISISDLENGTYFLQYKGRYKMFIKK